MDPSQWPKVRLALEFLLDGWQEQGPDAREDRIRQAAQEVGVEPELLRELLNSDRPSASLAEGVDVLALLDQLAPWEE